MLLYILPDCMLPPSLMHLSVPPRSPITLPSSHADNSSLHFLILLIHHPPLLLIICYVLFILQSFPLIMYFSHTPSLSFTINTTSSSFTPLYHSFTYPFTSMLYFDFSIITHHNIGRPLLVHWLLPPLTLPQQPLYPTHLYQCWTSTITKDQAHSSCAFKNAGLAST